MESKQYDKLEAVENEVGSTPTELDLLYQKMPLPRTEEEFNQIFAYEKIYSKLQDLTDVFMNRALNTIGEVKLEVNIGNKSDTLSSELFKRSIGNYVNAVNNKMSDVRVVTAAARKWVELTDEQKFEQLKLTALLFYIKEDIYGMLHAKDCLNRWPEMCGDFDIQSAIDKRTKEFVEAYKGLVVPSLSAYAYNGHCRLFSIGREGWDPTTVQYRVF